MDTILYITDLHVGAHVAELAGVFDRASAFRWRVIEIEVARTTRPLRELIKQWNPAGCILEGSHVVTNIRKTFGSIPVVYLDPAPKTVRTAKHTVANDPERIARWAKEELAKANPASYAFIGWCTPTVWSTERARVFSSCVRDELKEACHVFKTPWEIGDSFGAQQAMATFLARLPRPIGIFAVNDYAAVQATEACRQLGWTCPDDFLLVSVDNEEMHCENAVPTITSIKQDFRGAGRLAADLLARLIADPKLPEEHLKFGPVRLERRQSSRSFKLKDPRITRAVERIRRDATTGISASDILAEIPLSRRLAEKRFLAATGKTILQEIQHVRLEKVFELLATDIPIGHIASRCGMQSDSFLKRFFKTRTGMTLREWRKRHAT